MNILSEIADKTRDRIAQEENKLPLPALRTQAEAMNSNTGFPFAKALRAPGLSLIAEVKRASPSKGLIAEDFPYLAIAKEYEAAGAAAISCLTEPYWFQGEDRYLREIAAEVQIPVLRKDFTVSPYMIYQAKVLGAAAILLISTLLSDAELQEYISLARSLGLSTLTEAHTEKDIRRSLDAGAEIIGVNNRDLTDFTVDIGTSIRMRSLVPKDILFVSESGMQSRKDTQPLEENGTDAVLIGETLMRAPDKAAMIRQLRGESE